jgi:hypothetical protein
MKKTSLSVLSIAVSLLLLCSCRRDEPAPDGQDGHLLRMNLNGTLWQAPGEGPNAAAVAIDNRTNILTITGSDGDKLFFMTISGVTGTGTYQIGSPGLTLFTGQGSANRKGYVINLANRRSHGTLTVTEITGSVGTLTFVKGTFSGVAYSPDVAGTDSLVITNGEFASFP